MKMFRDTNTYLLFHGTRSVNVGGILKSSLRLPKTLVGVQTTGAMFGPGLYFADDWKKSAGYTSLDSSYWSGGSGGISGRGAFLFVCDVVLGNSYVSTRAKGFSQPPDGFHSVFGSCKGIGSLMNNEFIIYNTNQHRLRYLVEFNC